jgi:peptidoglycan/LPS O-acetylase OafA/YrhL
LSDGCGDRGPDGFFGLTSAFALVATILAAWMAWRIVEKTGAGAGRDWLRSR